MDSTKLKPCPFCGRDDTAVIHNHGMGFLAVACSATLGGCGVHTGWKETPEDAADAWNRRADLNAGKLAHRPNCKMQKIETHCVGCTMSDKHALGKEIKRLKKQNSAYATLTKLQDAQVLHYKTMAHDYQVKIATVESERQANAQLTEEIERMALKIDGYKTLVETQRKERNTLVEELGKISIDLERQKNANDHLRASLANGPGPCAEIYEVASRKLNPVAHAGIDKLIDKLRDIVKKSSGEP